MRVRSKLTLLLKQGELAMTKWLCYGLTQLGPSQRLGCTSPPEQPRPVFLVEDAARLEKESTVRPAPLRLVATREGKVTPCESNWPKDVVNFKLKANDIELSSPKVFVSWATGNCSSGYGWTGLR